MSTSGYSEEELAGLSEEERAAIEAEVDETELTATASPVDLPDEDGEEDGDDTGTANDEDGEDAGEDLEGEDAEDGGEGTDDEGQGDDAGDDQGDEGAEGDDAGEEDPAPAELEAKEEPVNPYEYSDGAKEQLKDLREQLNDGDLSPAEYEEKADAIKSDDYKARLQESENRRWGNAVMSFLGRHKDYTQEANPVKFAALDSEVKRMANAGEIGNMTHRQILEQAKANVEKAFGGAVKQEPPADTGKKDKGKPAKPKAEAPDAPNLGDVPAAGVENPRANNSEFAHLDKLNGVELEAALEKMTPAQQERYLAGR